MPAHRNWRHQIQNPNRRHQIQVGPGGLSKPPGPTSSEIIQLSAVKATITQHETISRRQSRVQFSNYEEAQSGVHAISTNSTLQVPSMARRHGDQTVLERNNHNHQLHPTNQSLQQPMCFMPSGIMVRRMHAAKSILIDRSVREARPGTSISPCVPSHANLHHLQFMPAPVISSQPSPEPVSATLLCHQSQGSGAKALDRHGHLILSGLPGLEDCQAHSTIGLAFGSLD